MTFHVLFYEKPSAEHLSALITGEGLHFLMYHSYVHPQILQLQLLTAYLTVYYLLTQVGMVSIPVACSI